MNNAVVRWWGVSRGMVVGSGRLLPKVRSFARLGPGRRRVGSIVCVSIVWELGRPLTTMCSQCVRSLDVVDSAADAVAAGLSGAGIPMCRSAGGMPAAVSSVGDSAVCDCVVYR